MARARWLYMNSTAFRCSRACDSVFAFFCAMTVARSKAAGAVVIAATVASWTATSGTARRTRVRTRGACS
eukprot:7384716-Prymnesium_polylepis.1